MGLPEGEAKKASSRWDTLEKVVDTINRWGFQEAETPKVEQPDVTAESLLSPDVKQYTVLYASLLVWTNYVSKLNARVIGELLQLENEMGDIAAETRKRLRKENEGRTKTTGKMSEEAMEDEILTTARYRELKIRAQEAKQFKIELDVRAEELRRSMQVVSRNIEVRKEEMSGGRQEGNMPQRTGDGRPWTNRR
jgi:hypothetical protein